MAAHRALQPVVAAAGDEVPVGLQLDEGNLVQLHQRRPVGPEIVDRQADIVQADLARDLGQEVEVADRLLAVDLDRQPAEGRMRRHAAAEIAHRLRLLQIGRGQVDREIDRSLLLQQKMPVPHDALDHEFGEVAQMRVVLFGNEIGGGTTPQVGCRIRTSASAPLRTSVRASILG